MTATEARDISIDAKGMEQIFDSIKAAAKLGFYTIDLRLTPSQERTLILKGFGVELKGEKHIVTW